MGAGVRKAQPLKAASRPVAVGANVLVIGNPFGALPNTVTNGLVRGTGRQLTDGNTTYDKLVETDAVFNPRNIGGPLCNLVGDLARVGHIVAPPSVLCLPAPEWPPLIKGRHAH